jgi:PTH1 family peptidyl-tRNA hydrolase
MKIIVGLGNPGEKYELTRHNAGFLAIDALALRLGLTWSANKKCRADMAKNDTLILVKPATFMNDSGLAVRSVLSYFHLLPKTFGLITVKNADLSAVLTVLHDDLDISLGKYKLSIGSRSAGHKGVESIISHCRTKNFTRVRLGIRMDASEKIPTGSASRNKAETAKFVLQKFSASELAMVQKAIAKVLTEINF